MRASWCHGRGDFAAAAPMYESLVRADPTDAYSAFMLASCCEAQERVTDGLEWADVAATRLPDSLAALQLAARLAIAAGHHERATDYVVRALALPEVRAEMPREALVPRPIMWLLRTMSYLPFLRRRLRPAALAQLEPGHQAAKLQEWKEWAMSYVAWRSGTDYTPQQSEPH